MVKTYFIKTDQKEGKLKVEPDQVIEIDSHTQLKIPRRFSIYYKNGKSFFTYNTILNILFFFCLIILVLLKFIFYNLFLNCFERNFEILISNICFAFIASFIFYNIVTKGIDKQKKMQAYAVICGILDSIVSSGKLVEKQIWNGNFKNDRDGFVKACKVINLSEIEPNRSNTKAEYLIFYSSKSIRTDIKILFTYMPFLESEILHQVNNIENSTFTKYINVLLVLKEKNLNKFSSDIIEFLDMIFELEKVNSKLKSKYLKNYIKKN